MSHKFCICLYNNFDPYKNCYNKISCIYQFRSSSVCYNVVYIRLELLLRKFVNISLLYVPLFSLLSFVGYCQYLPFIRNFIILIFIQSYLRGRDIKIILLREERSKNCNWITVSKKVTKILIQE